MRLHRRIRFQITTGPGGPDVREAAKAADLLQKLRQSEHARPASIHQRSPVFFRMRVE